MTVDSPSPPVTGRPRSARDSRLTIAAIVLAALVLVGSFLAWASVPIINHTVMGTDGDGILTIILAVLGVVMFLASGRRRWGRIVQLVCAALVVLIAVIDTVDVQRVADNAAFEVSVGGGLILVLVAGIAWTVVSALLLRMPRATAPSSPSREIG